MISGNNAIIDSIFKKFPHQEKLQLIYDRHRFIEPLITAEILKTTTKIGMKLEGLENSIKTASSIEDKIERQLNGKNNKEEILAKMNDIIRYTTIYDNQEPINEKVKEIVMGLEQQGYKLSACDNHFLNTSNGTGYKGIHLNFISPYGKDINPIEIQIHTPESYSAKQKCHEIYEDIRNISTPVQEKTRLLQEAREIFENVPYPNGYEKIKNYELSNPTRIDQKTNIEIKKKHNENISSVAYKITRDGEILANGFENRQTDGSVYIYKNNIYEQGTEASISKKGKVIFKNQYNNIIIDVYKAFEIAEKMEEEHTKWMIENQLEKRNVERLEKESPYDENKLEFDYL